MNTIVFHPWASLASDPDHPVELRIDLDPQPGTGFAEAVDAAQLLREVLDTQAGLKGFTADAVAEVFPRVTIPRFGFDVEALFIAQKRGFSVKQTAVHFRYDDEPTSVSFAQSAFVMAGEVLQVRFNDWRGRYD